MNKALVLLGKVLIRSQDCTQVCDESDGTSHQGEDRSEGGQAEAAGKGGILRPPQGPVDFWLEPVQQTTWGCVSR